MLLFILPLFSLAQTEYIQKHHPNGLLKMEGNLVSGVQQGLWNYYYENGKISSEIQLLNGKKEGHCKFYYENGKLQESSHWKNNKEVGEVKLYHKNGQLEKELNFKYGELHGPVKIFYKSGQLKQEGVWRDGKEDGFWRLYYENGSISYSGNMLGGKEDGFWQEYYVDGEIKQKTLFTEGVLVSRLCWDNEGEKQDCWFLVSETACDGTKTFELRDRTGGDSKKEGQLIQSFCLKRKLPGQNMLLTGIVYDTYLNGELKYQMEYEDGKYIGQVLYYLEDGSLYCDIKHKSRGVTKINYH